VPWLRVADISLFPDSLEINPYLTVMALADRVAEQLASELGETAVDATGQTSGAVTV
jgi:choline dehydrogenase-like flavoprotein